MSNSLIQDINVFSDHINKTNELDCTDRDSQGMTAYIAHNLDNTNVGFILNIKLLKCFNLVF